MTHRTMRSALQTCLSVNAGVKARMSLGMGDEAPTVHDVRWPISSLAKIAGSYRARRGDPLTPSPLAGEGGGEGCTGVGKSAKLDDIRKHDHVLTPGRFVGAEAADDGEPFKDNLSRSDFRWRTNHDTQHRPPQALYQHA